MYLQNIRLPKNVRDVQKSGILANKDYVPKPYPGRVTLFRAIEQPYGIYPDRTNGWGPFALGGIDIIDIPGHHGAMTFEPRVRVLANELFTRVDRAESEEKQHTSV
jgi:thioesterase domain-containing protein